MSTVTDWLAKQTVYTYDDAGRLTKTQYPNTVWADYAYDAADRLTSVVNRKAGLVTISSSAYTLDAAGNRTGMTGLAGSQSYYYDALYRITNPNYPGQSDAYMYDANGNRTLYNEVQYSYDAADQLTCAHHFAEQCPSGGTVYGYDANGNQTSRGSDSFTYDHENRMTTTSIGGVSGTYTYNGDGLRVSRNIGGTSVSYTWDVGAGLPVILQDSQGNTYVYGLDLISRTDSGGNQEYYLYDGLGSTTDLTNGSGTAIASYSYDVFGAIRSQAGSSSNEFKFTGEQVDSTSLQYLRARYHDPAIGRFLSRDPAGAGHPYAYVENNPVNFVDPRGLCIPEFNCPPGLGGGIYPPRLPRSKEGGMKWCRVGWDCSVPRPPLEGSWYWDQYQCTDGGCIGVMCYDIPASALFSETRHCEDVSRPDKSLVDQVVDFLNSCTGGIVRTAIAFGVAIGVFVISGGKTNPDPQSIGFGASQNTMPCAED